MNNEERKKFWDTLCSLEGENIEEDINRLSEVIIYPKKLYRYRPVSVKTLEALSTNKLYFSTANYYDDPFDTFINVRISEIRPAITSIENVDEAALINATKAVINEFGDVHVDDNNVYEMVRQVKRIVGEEVNVSLFESFFRNIRNEIKKDTYSVCFSESPLNENMWLKYADQYKGFAVEYDLADETRLLCGKQDKCANCGVYKYGTNLYPMYYSEEKYDATRFAQFLVACKRMGNNLTLEHVGKLKKLFGKQVWEREKITLIKKKCNHYDEEWRMIIPGAMNPTLPVMKEWIPSSVYLGLNMEPSEENLVVNTARSAGVDKIWKCYITDDGELGATTVAE